MPLENGEDRCGAIIAGGRSRRMGTDKRLLLFEGQTLLERACALLHGVCGEVLYAAPDPPPVSLDARHEADRFPGMGVLSGVHAALCGARSDRVLCIAVDTPLLTPDWLILLDRRCRETELPCIPEAGGRLHPVPGCYPVSVLASVEAALRDGRPAAHRLLREIGAVIIGEDEARMHGCLPGALANVNTPEDWRSLPGGREPL